MHLYPIGRLRAHRGFIISCVFFALVIFLFVLLFSSVSAKSQVEQQTVLLNALRRASVSCFAIEGRYPESLAYLKENYGITYDDEKFIVEYDAFASNVFPSISVLVKGASPL